jgi:hypothetical protein
MRHEKLLCLAAVLVKTAQPPKKKKPAADVGFAGFRSSGQLVELPAGYRWRAHIVKLSKSLYAVLLQISFAATLEILRLVS